jgi:hypothetical protein
VRPSLPIRKTVYHMSRREPNFAPPIPIRSIGISLRSTRCRMQAQLWGQGGAAFFDRLTDQEDIEGAYNTGMNHYEGQEWPCGKRGRGCPLMTAASGRNRREAGIISSESARLPVVVLVVYERGNHRALL